MHKHFLEKLKSPVSGKELHLNEGQNKLSDPYGNTFPIKEGVAVLLQENSQETHTNSTFHQKFDSRFKYIDHYQKDAEYFDYFEASDSKVIRNENKRLHQAIIRQVPKAASTLLDTGCGNAWVAAHFCHRGTDVVSMDISLPNPQKALKNHPLKNHLGVVADVYNLPFKAESFDTIIAAEVMEHLPDPKQFIANLFSVLKPNGRLILTTPYDEKINYALCVHCNKPTPHSAHIHSFNKSTIKKFLPDEIKDFKIITFGNRMLSKLRVINLFMGLPYTLWASIDRSANRLFSKTERMMIIIDK